MPVGGDGNHAAVVADAQLHDDAEYCAGDAELLWYMELRGMHHTEPVNCRCVYVSTEPTWHVNEKQMTKVSWDKQDCGSVELHVFECTNKHIVFSHICVTDTTCFCTPHPLISLCTDAAT